MTEGVFFINRIEGGKIPFTYQQFNDLIDITKYLEKEMKKNSNNVTCSFIIRKGSCRGHHTIFMKVVGEDVERIVVDVIE